MKKRFTLLIGATHTGTRRLFRLLGSHPQVLACRVAEPHFFTDDAKWALGPDWYRSLWDFREPDERIALEASPDYALDPRVPSPAVRIARMPAGFRFLYLLRDPLERIAGEHLERVADGLAGGPLGADDLAPYLDATRYAAPLARYREHFPREDFLLLSAEALSRGPRAELARACRFLEIDPVFAFPDAEARSPRRPPGRRWRLFGSRRTASGRASAALPQPLITPEAREAALRALRPEVARLAEEWGFDVSGWHLEP